VFGGGIIPQDDREELFSHGIRAIFGPGTPTSDILQFIDEARTRPEVGVGGSSDWFWTSSA